MSIFIFHLAGVGEARQRYVWVTEKEKVKADFDRKSRIFLYFAEGRKVEFFYIWIPVVTWPAKTGVIFNKLLSVTFKASREV